VPRNEAMNKHRMWQEDDEIQIKILVKTSNTKHFPIPFPFHFFLVVVVFFSNIVFAHFTLN
jgi:hypothetical protein